MGDSFEIQQYQRPGTTPTHGAESRWLSPICTVENPRFSKTNPPLLVSQNPKTPVFKAAKIAGQFFCDFFSPIYSFT